MLKPKTVIENSKTAIGNSKTAIGNGNDTILSNHNPYHMDKNTML